MIKTSGTVWFLLVFSLVSVAEALLEVDKAMSLQYLTLGWVQLIGARIMHEVQK